MSDPKSDNSPISHDGYVSVPKTALFWLMGLGDDFAPTPEQEARSTGPGRYWWRSEFCKRAGIDLVAMVEEKTK